MKGSRAYRARDVKRVDWEEVARGRGCEGVHVGLDVGKRAFLGVVRWEDGEFERPWLVDNPGEIREFVELLQRMGRGRELTVAMEPTGTYGDALRQGLADAGVRLERVSPKAAHDYAEVFDGVPSKHDGKDAAVIAELAALGKSCAWCFEPASEVDQEMAYWVDWMDAQRVQSTMWLGRLEGLLARHWPEATQWLKLNSATLLRILEAYGGPAGLAADRQAFSRVAGWGRCCLAKEKIDGLLQSASETAGVRQGTFEVRRMQSYASEALEARREVAWSKRRLADLARPNGVIQAQSQVVGVATACVLWVHLGDPREYGCAAAYRKAMGLNLAEHSSGQFQGRLRISKRGASEVRRWLYFAALRWVQQEPVKGWYTRKRERDAEETKRALIGVMRKLAKGLHHVGTTEEPFHVGRLFKRRSPGGGQSAKRSPMRRKR